MLRKYRIDDSQVMRDGFVANACYGGFGLSDEAMKRYRELGGNEEYDDDIRRTDPLLIRVVNEMGEAANSAFAALVVGKTCILHPGACGIDGEYDGLERFTRGCYKCRAPQINEHRHQVEIDKVKNRPRPRFNSI